MQLVDYWLVEKRVIYYEVGGKLSLADLQTLNDVITGYLNEGEPGHLVHALIHVKPIPETPRLADLLKTCDYLQHPRYGWAIFWGFQNPFLNMLAYWVYIATKVRYRAVANEQEAILFLQDVDPSLPDLNAHWQRRRS